MKKARETKPTSVEFEKFNDMLKLTGLPMNDLNLGIMANISLGKHIYICKHFTELENEYGCK